MFAKVNFSQRKWKHARRSTGEDGRGGPWITTQNIPHPQVCTQSLTCGQHLGCGGRLPHLERLITLTLFPQQSRTNHKSKISLCVSSGAFKGTCRTSGSLMCLMQKILSKSPRGKPSPVFYCVQTQQPKLESLTGSWSMKATAAAHSSDQCFPVNDWSSRAQPGHLENISLERRGPFVG